MPDNFTIFAGSANRHLAEAIARALGVEVGACGIERFPDGEVSIRLDEPVRGRKVFIVQATSPPSMTISLNCWPLPMPAAAHPPRALQPS